MWAAQRERGRFDTAVFAKAMMKFQPFWQWPVRSFYRRSRYRSHHDLASIVGAQVRLEIERLEVVDHALMLALIREALCPAVALAVEGNRREGDEESPRTRTMLVH